MSALYALSSRMPILLLIILCSQNVFAFLLQDLFLNRDQQGIRALQDGDPRGAATKFITPAWQGVAHYRAHDYEKALNNFSEQKDAMGYYNRGNALAHLGRYDEAIAAYDKALALEPNFEDAKFNRDLLKKLKEQQQANQKNQNSQQQQSSQSSANNNAAQNKQSQNASIHSEKNNDSQKQNNTQQANNPENSSTTASQQQKTAQEDYPQQSSPRPSNTQSRSTSSTMNNQPNNLPNSTQFKSQSEQQQTEHQYLERVPDNPGSLLRQIFLRDYLKRQGQLQQQDD